MIDMFALNKENFSSIFSYFAPNFKIGDIDDFILYLNQSNISLLQIEDLLLKISPYLSSFRYESNVDGKLIIEYAIKIFNSDLHSVISKSSFNPIILSDLILKIDKKYNYPITEENIISLNNHLFGESACRSDLYISPEFHVDYNRFYGMNFIESVLIKIRPHINFIVKNSYRYEDEIPITIAISVFHPEIEEEFESLEYDFFEFLDYNENIAFHVQKSLSLEDKRIVTEIKYMENMISLSDRDEKIKEINEEQEARLKLEEMRRDTPLYSQEHIDQMMNNMMEGEVSGYWNID